MSKLNDVLIEWGMALEALGEALQDESTTIKELSDVARKAGLDLQIRFQWIEDAVEARASGEDQ